MKYDELYRKYKELVKENACLKAKLSELSKQSKNKIHYASSVPETAVASQSDFLPGDSSGVTLNCESNSYTKITARSDTDAK